MAGHEAFEQGGAADHEAQWQKHVVVALWVLLVLFLLGSLALVYGKAHGFFQALPQDATAPWSAGWP